MENGRDIQSYIEVQLSLYQSRERELIDALEYTLSDLDRFNEELLFSLTQLGSTKTLLLEDGLEYRERWLEYEDYLIKDVADWQQHIKRITLKIEEDRAELLPVSKFIIRLLLQG